MWFAAAILHLSALGALVIGAYLVTEGYWFTGMIPFAWAFATMGIEMRSTRDKEEK